MIEVETRPHNNLAQTEQADEWLVIPAIEITAGHMIEDIYGSRKHSVVIDVDTDAAKHALELIEEPGTDSSTVYLNLERDTQAEHMGVMQRVQGYARALPNKKDSITTNESLVAINMGWDNFRNISDHERELQEVTVHELKHVTDFNNSKAILINIVWPVWQRVRHSMLSHRLGYLMCKPFIKYPHIEVHPYMDSPQERAARKASSSHAHQIPQIISIKRERIPRNPGPFRRFLSNLVN